MTRKLKQLLDALSSVGYLSRYRYAKSTRACLMCGSPASSFRDEWGKLEYNVSALCQSCQDKYFSGD
jgi:phosphoribosyl-dephospho-CoA transferase